MLLMSFHVIFCICSVRFSRFANWLGFGHEKPSTILLTTVMHPKGAPVLVGKAFVPFSRSVDAANRELGNDQSTVASSRGNG